MASLTVENYVKAVFNACLNGKCQRATTGQLAEAMNVSPGTVTSMLKTLNERGLVDYTPYEGVQLTAEGKALALNVLRRHRLIELFLTKSLGLGWHQVHDDAERMEHVVSDGLVERIDEYLDHPQFDPHGDPIPSTDGSVPHRDTQLLADCPVGCDFSIARVADQSPEFLQYLERSGLVLGVNGTVTENQGEAGTVTIKVGGLSKTLGYEAARKLHVLAPALARKTPSPYFAVRREASSPKGRFDDR